MVWSINASFAVHMEMKSYTGYFLSLGTGFPISGSFGQKRNSRSLTKSELIGIDDAIGFVEWASLYYKDQVKEYPTENPFRTLARRILSSKTTPALSRW